MSALTTFLVLSLTVLVSTSFLNAYHHESNREFLRLLGRTADPCNKWTKDVAGLTDCQTVPDAQVTVLLPSVNSVVPGNHHSQIGLTKKGALLASTFRLTIEGRGFGSSDFTDQNNLPNPAPANSRFHNNPFAVADPVGQLPETNAAGSYFYLARFGANCAQPDILLGRSAAFYHTDARISFAVPVNWMQIALELESAPRHLCYVRNAPAVAAAPLPAAAAFYTGFKIGVVWNCDDADTTKAQVCPPPPITPKADQTAGYGALTFTEWLQRASKKICCRGTLDGAGIQFSNALGDENLRIGQCHMGPAQNPLTPTACCGSATIERAVERCCNGPRELVAWHASPCSCTRNDQTCPTSEQCCLPNKYTELAQVFDGVGECYNPSTHKCCDTGLRYDPGVQQCCSINGLQSLNIPCPCGTHTDCWGGQLNEAKLVNLRCCTQVNPAINEQLPFTGCNAYNNFPNGTGNYEVQRCPGTCIDPSYQICCNGVHCVRQFEKCCNSSCCNRFSQSCTTAIHSGTPGNRYNFNEFRVQYEACTTIEQMQPLKAFWTIIVPLACLVISFFATGLTLVFANKASSRSYAAIEKAMINIALLAIIFNLVIFFSPSWKYGLVILFVQLFTILTAAARIQKLNAVCLALQVLLVFYLVDPFHGNQYLTLASSRNTNGFADRDSAGLIHYIGKMFKSDAQANMFNGSEQQFCPNFYLGFFRRDPQLYDYDRFTNPERTVFGLCDRSFILALLVFASLIYICAFVQMILGLLALLLRFQKASVTLALREE